MANRVAEIEVYAGLEDRDLIAGLRRAEAEVEKTARKIASERAEATIGADLSELKRDLKAAEAELKKFEKRKRDKTLTADERRYAAQQAQRYQNELTALGKSLAAENKRLAVLKSENVEHERAARLTVAQAKLDEKHAKLLIAQEKRRTTALREEERLIASSERASIQRARAAERERVESITGLSKQRAQVVGLQREYAKLTERIERLNKRRAFTTEGRAKLALDTGGVYAQMELVKAKLKVMGEEPPVEIQVEMERRKSMTRMRRSAAQFGDIFRTIAEKAANLGSIAIRLGPFTETIKQFAVALGFVGPLLISVLGGLGALVGVMGAGIAGAAVVGTAGLTGFGLAFGGIKMSLKSAAADYKLAQAATEAYGKAVDKYGKGSKEAKNAQQQMNSVLKSVSPLAREAAMGMQEFRSNWDKSTAPTQKSFGNIAKGYFGALNAVRPMWAKSTNELSGILDKSLRGGFKFFKSSEFKDNFKAITSNFNAAVPSFMHALGSIGRAFLNLGREGSKFLKPFGESVDNMADKLLKWTQSDDFGATIKRWAGYAADLGRFLGALTSVIVHFFGAGASAGGNFLESMTKALNRWDDWLTSAGGRNEIAEGFERAVEGTKDLWNALAPLIGVFVAWSSTMTPFIGGLLKGVGLVMQLFTGISKLLGLGGPMAALGVTLGSIWAVGKVGAFVAALARIPAVLRTIAATSGALGAIGAVFNGRLIAGMRGGAGAAGAVAAGGAQAGAAMRAGVVSGGAVAAAQMRAAMVAGGAAAAAGGLVGGRRGPGPVGAVPVARGPGALVGAAPAKGAEAAAKSVGKLGAAGNLAKGALAGLGAVALGVPAVIAGVTIAAGAAAYGIYKWSTRTRQWEKDTTQANKSLEAFRNISGAVKTGYTDLAGASNQAAQSQLSLKSAVRQSNAEEKQLAAMRSQGKRGTDEYNAAMEQHKQTLLSVKDARLQDFAAAQNRTKLYNDQKKAISETTKESEKALAAAKRAAQDTGLGEALKKMSPKELLGMLADKAPIFKKQKAALEALIGAQRVASQQDERAAVNMSNLKRSMAGLTPMAQSAGKALATVSRLGGKKLQTQISLKFQDPGQAQRVAASAAKSLRGGVPKTVTSRIVADSRNAEEAIRRLQNARINPVRLRIVEEGGSRAVAMVERLSGIKLGPKNQRIAEKGGAAAIALLERLRGVALPPKRQNVRESGANAVIGALNTIRSLNLTDKHQRITIETIRIETVRRRTAAPPGAETTSRASGGYGAAMGRGVGASQPNERQIQRAMVTAQLAGARKTQGGRYSQPTLLVGEENRSEIVISTNPKYRKRNKGYLAAAARALGATVESAAAGSLGTSTAGGFNPSNYEATKLGSAKTAPKYSKKAVKRASRKTRNDAKKGKKLRSLAKIGAQPWGKRTQFLEDQQDVWERELAIRQSQVTEPEDFMMNDPSGAVIPGTKDPMQVVDVDAVNKFKASLVYVQEAFNQITQVISGLMQAIPNAIREMTSEMTHRDYNIGQLNTAIKTNDKLAKSKNKKTAERARSRAAKYREERDRQKTERDAASESKKELEGKLIDTGFDYRENAIASGENQSDINKLQERADKSVAEANRPPDTGDSGGSGSGAGADAPLSIEAQTAMALQQNAQTLAAFGSNFLGNTATAQFAAGAVAGAGAGGGAATVSNPASLGTGSAAGEAFEGSRSAATYVSQSGSYSGSGGSGGSAGGSVEAGSTVNNTVNNTFLAPPPDPHTWSRGVEFELGGMV